MRIILLTLLLTGCSWIESEAGKAHYSYTVTQPDGTRHEIVLKNAKDIGLVSATATRLEDGTIEIELIEQGVDATTPMAKMVEQNGKLIEMLTNALP